MGPLAYKIRKYGGSLIVIGHDRKDVHPLIRELGTAIHKEGLKEATFYQDVRNRRGHRPIMSVTRIPRDRLAVRRQRSRRPGSQSGDDEEDVEYDDVIEDVAMWTIVNEREREGPVAYRQLAKRRRGTPLRATLGGGSGTRRTESTSMQLQRVENLIA